MLRQEWRRRDVSRCYWLIGTYVANELLVNEQSTAQWYESSRRKGERENGEERIEVRHHSTPAAESRRGVLECLTTSEVSWLLQREMIRGGKRRKYEQTRRK
jgi:hypothetical protein